ncbi:hypothetical protein GE061_013874 [Apolygus lucorum]|uniref:UBA domain-containing protein n=1 Tax=Apolygus lucorum TaxID=248454 RepID=A0A6A4KC24_APOLU|nr:hypothetical protein GE061_013874 [Apolygus lucorum]
MKEEPLITPVKVNDQKSKPTADQMRIAQILDKKVVDTTIKQKLKQVMDATQRSAEEVYVALHDSDFDVNRAVDLLIEGDSLADWCTSEKKKKKLQELKEKKTEDNPVVPENSEEATKDPRNNSFRGRGDDRRRPGRGRGSQNSDRRHRDSNEESSRGEGFRGRGSQGRGRRGRTTPGGTMVFERSNMGQEQNNPGFQPPMTAVKNRWERPLIHNARDDWDTEEFTGSLSQTQIFTSSAKRDMKKVEVVVEEPKKPQNLPDVMNGSPKSLTTPLPQPPMVQNHSPQTFRPHEMGFGPVNSAFMKREALPQQEVRSVNVETLSNSPSEPHSEYLYRLSNFASKPDLHIPTSEERKPVPSKIPTSAVEMPPEMKSSLPFLDIQFGAMDLGPSASEATSSESLSNISSQNASTTNLIPPSSLTSSASMTQLIANNSISSSTSSNNLVQSTSISHSTSGNMMGPNSIPSVTGVGHLQPSSISSASNVNHLTPSTIPSGTNVNHLVNNMTSGGVSHMMGPNNMTAGSNHHLGPSLSTGPPGSQTQGRFMAASQPYATNHLPYSYITPPSGASSHQYEPRAHETNTSIPPPLIAQPPHLPPFKQTPPGVPKGAIVANLPPGSLVGNQYIVGQSNVPYFPHHPIYYYEEVPPVMNNQQRLAHHMPSGYDVSYQSTSPANRDGVHYNV